MSRSRRRSAPGLLWGAAALLAQLFGVSVAAAPAAVPQVPRPTAVAEAAAPAAPTAAVLPARPWPPPRPDAGTAQGTARPWPPPRPGTEHDDAARPWPPPRGPQG